MKKFLYLFFSFAVFTSCKSKGKSSVEKADSVNQAVQDSSLNNGAVVVDEESAAFLVRVANSGMAETQMAAMAQQKAVYPAVRDFAAMLYRDHSAVNEKVKSLAAQKNIHLPDTITAEKRKDIDNLQKMTGKNLDKGFIDIMIKNHEAGVDLFDKAQLNTKDLDIRSFAGKTLPTLKMHLDSARALKKTYW